MPLDPGGFVEQAGAGPLDKLFDGNGSPEGLAVSFDGDRMLEVAGMFPMSLQARQYGILSAGAAYDREYGKPRPTPPGSPIVALTHAELDYVVVRAGDYGFYEPVYLYSGTFRINGTDYVKQVLAPALAPV